MAESGVKVGLRPMECELSLLQRADGSARVRQGNTSVLCAVYGPAEVKAAKEQCDKATLEVIVKPCVGQTNPRDRLLESFVASCCEAAILLTLHPHTAISLTLQVESDDGALLSVLAHACCLALLDACVPMAFTFSCLCCTFTSDGEMFTDPTASQEKKSNCELAFVVESIAGDVITSHTLGAYSKDQLRQVMLGAQEASKTVTEFYRLAIKRKLSKDAKYAELNVAV